MALDLDNILKASGAITLAANTTHSTRFTNIGSHKGEFLEVLNLNTQPLWYTLDYTGDDETAVTPSDPETFCVPVGGRGLHKIAASSTSLIVNCESTAAGDIAIQVKDLS